MSITEVDRKILKAGYIQGTQKGQKAFFEKLKLNRSTVDYVLEKMKKDKFYTRKSYEINLSVLGINKFAWVFISINWHTFDEDTFLKKTLSFPEVTSIFKITGDFDYALYIIGKNISQINEFILNFEKIFSEYIDNVNIIFSNKEYKRHFIKTLNVQESLPNKIDCIILNEKLLNPDMSFTEISKKYNIHRNTISNRWKKIWKDQLILKEHLELTEEGYREIGMGLKLFMLLKPIPGKEEILTNNLIKIEEVENVFTTLSNEIIINIRVSDSQSLDHFHAKIMKGKEKLIKTSKTVLVIGGKKKAFLTMDTLTQVNPNVCEMCKLDPLLRAPLK